MPQAWSASSSLCCGAGECDLGAIAARKTVETDPHLLALDLRGQAAHEDDDVRRAGHRQELRAAGRSPVRSRRRRPRQAPRTGSTPRRIGRRDSPGAAGRRIRVSAPPLFHSSITETSSMKSRKPSSPVTARTWSPDLRGVEWPVHRTENCRSERSAMGRRHPVRIDDRVGAGDRQACPRDSGWRSTRRASPGRLLRGEDHGRDEVVDRQRRPRGSCPCRRATFVVFPARSRMPWRGVTERLGVPL